MTLPDQKYPHPAWKLMHAIIGLAGLIWLTYHGADMDGGTAGAVGGASSARLLWLTFFAKG